MFKVCIILMKKYSDDQVYNLMQTFLHTFLKARMLAAKQHKVSKMHALHLNIKKKFTNLRHLIHMVITALN